MASTPVWQHAASFADTNTFMLDNQVLCDVTLVSGTDKQEIPCHRFILASRSPVFYTMFCGSLPETGRVEIPDIEAETLRNVIRYFKLALCVKKHTCVHVLHIYKALLDVCKNSIQFYLQSVKYEIIFVLTSETVRAILFVTVNAHDLLQVYVHRRSRYFHCLSF